MTTPGTPDTAAHERADELYAHHSTAELLRQLADETSTLVRQELALARSELQDKGREAGMGVGMVGGAGVASLLTLGALTATVIAALDTAMPTWAAALITTVLWALVSAVLALTGRARLRHATPLTPEQTIEITKEDVAWARTRARSATR